MTLPTSHIDALDIVVNAGLGDINLASAQVTNLDVTTNAAKTTVDLSEASVANIAGTVNAGVLAFRLAASADTVASIEVNAGSLRVCAPSGLGLAVHHTGVLSGLSVDGQHQDSRDWESPDYAAAAHHGDLDVNVNLGSVEINPIGGCK